MASRVSRRWIRDESSIRVLPPPDLLTLVQLAKRLYAVRRARAQQLPIDIFADPAWDILLDLFVSEGTGRRLSVSDVCFGADLSPATALRYVAVLESEGLVRRRADPGDARRTNLSLTPDGLARMTTLLKNF